MANINAQLIKVGDSFPLYTAPTHLGDFSAYSIQIVVFSGSFDIRLQCSCDEGSQFSSNDSSMNTDTWTDIAGSAKSLVAGDDLLYDISPTGYKWVRIYVVGSGTMESRINAKGG